MNTALQHLVFYGALCSLATLPACALAAVQGSGVVIPETRAVDSFHAIEIGGSAEVFLTSSETPSLVIECDDNLLPHIVSEVRDGTLQLGFERGSWSPSQTTVYRIGHGALDRIALSGSVRLHGGELTSDSLVLEQSGSSKVDFTLLSIDRLKLRTSGSGNLDVGYLESRELDYSVSGSGRLEVAQGEVDTVAASISGSGRMTMPSVRVRQMDFRCSGSGKAQVWVEEALDVSVSGAGRVDYRGTPKISSRISGSGRVQQLEE